MLAEEEGCCCIGGGIVGEPSVGEGFGEPLALC